MEVVPPQCLTVIHWIIVQHRRMVFEPFFFFLSGRISFVYINNTGTHVAGIIAADATGKYETNYTPYIPFVGVAPQVTLGACKSPYLIFAVVKLDFCTQDRVLGCSGSGSTGTYNYLSPFIIARSLYRCSCSSNLSCL